MTGFILKKQLLVKFGCSRHPKRETVWWGGHFKPHPPKAISESHLICFMLVYYEINLKTSINWTIEVGYKKYISWNYTIFLNFKNLYLQFVFFHLQFMLFIKPCTINSTPCTHESAVYTNWLQYKLTKSCLSGAKATCTKPSVLKLT